MEKCLACAVHVSSAMLGTAIEKSKNDVHIIYATTEGTGGAAKSRCGEATKSSRVGTAV